MAIQTATATFTGAEETISVVWTTPFAVAPTVSVGVGVTDGATLECAATNVTTTGCDLKPTSAFHGKAEAIAIT